MKYARQPRKRSLAKFEQAAKRVGVDRERLVREFQSVFPNLFETLVAPPSEGWLAAVDLDRVVRAVLGRRNLVVLRPSELADVLVREGIVAHCGPAWAGRLARLIGARAPLGVVVRVRRTSKARGVEFARTRDGNDGK